MLLGHEDGQQHSHRLCLRLIGLFQVEIGKQKWNDLRGKPPRGREGELPPSPVVFLISSHTRGVGIDFMRTLVNQQTLLRMTLVLVNRSRSYVELGKDLITRQSVVNRRIHQLD